MHRALHHSPRQAAAHAGGRGMLVRALLGLQLLNQATSRLLNRCAGKVRGGGACAPF